MDGSRWISCKPNFFLPVFVLSKLFRRLMLEKLLAAHAGGQAAVPRLTRASRRREGVRGVPRPAQQEALVRLRQAPVRGPEGRARLSVALHPPRRHLEPPPDRGRRAQRHLQGQGLQDRRPRPLHHDDARRRRVHPPVPHPRPAQRLPSHPPLRLVRQRAIAPRRSRGRANSWVWPRLRPRRRSRSIRRRRRHSPSPAPAAAAACSSSRPSRPAANHAIGRPRLSSQSGSTPHERGHDITHPHRQARSSLVTDPATAALGRTAARHRFPQRNHPRKRIVIGAQASPRHTSARHHLTATLSRLASTVKHRDQIAIARASPSAPHLPRVPSLGGFRTTAPVPAESSRWAVIRNPSQSRPNWTVPAMSALHPIATEPRTSQVVRFVPKGGISS